MRGKINPFAVPPTTAVKILFSEVGKHVFGEMRIIDFPLVFAFVQYFGNLNAESKLL